jgi:hypothetical protein
MSVDHRDVQTKVLKIAIEGVSGDPVIVSHPDPSKIIPCGDKVKNRNCKGSRNYLNKKKPIKFRFMPSDYTEDGDYLPDNGKKYGASGKAYGWSKDMSNRMRSFVEASSQELHSLVRFLPSPKSKKCTRPGTSCENVNWSVKVGQGVFFVRLYVGDPQSRTKVDLMVNDKFLAENKNVDENKLKVFEGIIEAKNEFVIITSNCKTNCDDSVSKLNAVEIMPYENKPKEDNKKSKEIQISCGRAVTGGRCDKGPDVTHCLFDDPSAKVAGNCTGQLVIMQIPNTYQCKDQIGKYKCVRKIYKNEEECKTYCVNNCKKAQCIS